MRFHRRGAARHPQTLSPAERLAFVLHGIFDLPYAEIAPIMARSESTAAQLASRATPRARKIPLRIRPQGWCASKLVDAFLAAPATVTSMPAGCNRRRRGVARRPAGTPTTIRGAGGRRQCARLLGQCAVRRRPHVDGAVGIVGRLGKRRGAFSVAAQDHRDHIDADPRRLSSFKLALLIDNAYGTADRLRAGHRGGTQRLHPPAGARPAVAVHRPGDAAQLGWLENGWVAAIVALLVVEIVADKIPLSTASTRAIQTFVRPTAGGIVFGFARRADAAVTDPGAFAHTGQWIPSPSAWSPRWWCRWQINRAACGNVATAGMAAPVLHRRGHLRVSGWCFRDPDTGAGAGGRARVGLGRDPIDAGDDARPRLIQRPYPRRPLPGADRKPVAVLLQIHADHLARSHDDVLVRIAWRTTAPRPRGRPHDHAALHDRAVVDHDVGRQHRLRPTQPNDAAGPDHGLLRRAAVDERPAPASRSHTDRPSPVVEV